MSLIGTVWEAGKTIVKTCWDFCLTGWTFFVALILVVVTAVTTLITSVLDLLTTLLSKLAAITVPNSNVSQSVGDWLSVANTFAPVQEGFGLLIVVSTLWVAMLIYRFIKSWIPTVS
jgi:hypothetical protein